VQGPTSTTGAAEQRELDRQEGDEEGHQADGHAHGTLDGSPGLPGHAFGSPPARRYSPAVPRLTRDQLVAQLEAQGLRFKSVTLSTEGEYLPTDVDWNNKDTLHLNHVHTWVRDVTFVLDRDVQSTVSLQRVLGATFPLVLTHYDNGPNHQTHVVALLAWTIVTRHEFVPVSATRTRAVTSYSVGGNRFWMAFFPVIRWTIRRNYRRLMSEDVPLRERRGVLRSWGYTFRGDGPEPRDLRASMPVTADNVLLPEAPGPAHFDPVPIARLSEGTPVLVGRSDHLGLRLERHGHRVLALPRLCPHEGAALDDAEVDADCLRCPWHGRRLPGAVLDLDEDEPRAATTWHRLWVEEDRLHIGPADGTAQE
jgi:nitrite reductase/ring-hydroxylating ferredoxin subunit